MVALLPLVLLVSCAGVASGKDRVYYIASIDIDWDYAPHGTTKTRQEFNEEAATFLDRGDTTIGKVYKKAVYRQFTDASFSQQVAHPDYLGVLGPILRAEVGDRFVIHYKNLASRGYTMHPHGVQYEKNSEGAMYIDGTNGTDKADDKVPPQGTHTYIWNVGDTEAPTGDDPNCLPWVYHSHVLPEKDTNTGLIGIMLTCKKGTLNDAGERTDVDKEFGLLFTVLDENLSWYLSENVKKYTKTPSKVDQNDGDFQESNLMHGINGYLYNNLPVVNMCRDTRVVWYVLAMGTEVDIHGVQFHGQSIQLHGHRSDGLNLFPADLVSVAMTPDAPGHWLLECNVFDHHMAGMFGHFQVDECNSTSTVPEGTPREYYIAAEPIEWNYAPSGLNLYDGGSLTEPNSYSVPFFEPGPKRIGSTYKKVKYVQYTDATFKTKTPVTKHQQHLGILGPVIRAEVSERIRIHFKNMADRKYSLQARGVHFAVSDHGEHASTNPGSTRVYDWTVPESMGPGEKDPDCVTRIYYSSNFPRDTYAGLVGPMLVCRKDTLFDNQQDGVDKEFFLFFMVMDENESWYIEDNVRKYCTDTSVDLDDEDFRESNSMHSINGYVYNNMPSLEMCAGDNVNWHVFGLGTESDLHTLTFGGNAFTYHEQQRSALPVFPGSLATIKMKPDNTGNWPLICWTNEHFNAGMKMKYRVNPCGRRDVSEPDRPANRTYYLAVIEQEWDYTPINHISPKTKQPLDKDEEASVFVKSGPHAIGSKYKKALFREFTDSSFTKEKVRSAEEKHLHMLGPYIKTEVGETIKIVFKNKASRAYTLGSPSALLNVSGQVDPQQTVEYKWNVLPSHGPGPKDPACIAHPYFSTLNTHQDTNSGLVGPMVICRRGTLGKDNKRKDVDREFAVLFAVTDENYSWYLDDNINKYCTDPKGVDKSDEDFQESNKMHGINGRVYGNADGLVMKVGEKVVWYLLGMGDEVDTHTVHFHGTTVTQFTDVTHRTDVVGVFPGTSHVVQMEPHTAAEWLFHCHVNDHVTAGMETTYHVLAKDGPPASRGASGKSSSEWLLISLLVLRVAANFNPAD